MGSTRRDPITSQQQPAQPNHDTTIQPSSIAVTLGLTSFAYLGLLVSTDMWAEYAFPLCIHPVKCFDFETELRNSIGSSYEPCDDLYLHVCSRWKDNYPRSGNQFRLLNQRTKYVLYEALLEPQRAKSSSVLDKVALGFQQCINVLANQEDHRNIIAGLFDQYHFKWPSLRLPKEFDLLDFSVGLALDYDISTLFGLSVVPYYRTDSKYTLMLSAAQGYLEPVYTIDYLISNVDIGSCIHLFDPYLEEERDVYVSVIVTFLHNLFVAQNLANIDFIVNYTTLADFTSISPTIPPADWVRTINKHLPQSVRLTETDDILVYSGALVMLRHVLPVYKNNIPELMVAVGFLLVQRLSNAFSYEQLKCMDTALGAIPDYHPLHTEPCVEMMNRIAPFAMARILYDEILDPASVNITRNIFKNIMESTYMSYSTLHWMTNYTRHVAVDRLAALTQVVAMSEHLADRKTLDDFYSYLPPFDKYFIVDYIEASRQKMIKLKAFLAVPPPKAALPVRREDIEVSLIETGAFYMFLPHMMVIPGAIMQAPFVNAELPLPASYGSIGHVLGHELTHAFDPYTSRVSPSGDPKPMYDDPSAEEFGVRLACLHNQLNFATGSTTLGKNSISEAFADNAGMEKATLAFQRLQFSGKGMLGYTAPQLFYVSACFKFCGEYGDEVAEDEKYPPLHLRCDLPMANENYFLQVFHCPLGANMRAPIQCTFHK
ncbi:endothelin-converting enzyme 1-like [Ornithodoros turicata]|uniref:endothelin-converting enzyme 1-like n=1 Tax=Ornithodoros turicata TaxID=34597 RepID=UPI0031388754